MALLIVVGIAPVRAQGQWVVTMKQSKNPLPIGACSAVFISAVDPVTKGTPHSASGHYVSTIADFDMLAESSGYPAVVGKYESATLWSVCACQSATVGQQGTITATYPGAAVPEKSRVAGVSFKSTVAFKISAADGTYNPPGCDALKTTSAKVARTPSSFTPAPTTTPQPVTQTVASGRTNPTQASPPQAIAAPAAAPISNGTRSPLITVAGPQLVNPSGFTVRDRSNDRNIGGVDFKWNKVPGAVRYRITGTGLSAAGVTPLDTTISVGNTPSGPGSWKLVALYEGNVTDTTTASVASTVVRRLPPHSTPWLTHRNGAGTLAQVETPAHQVLNDDAVGGHTTGNLSGDLFPFYNTSYASWLGQTFMWICARSLCGDTEGDHFRPYAESLEGVPKCVSNDEHVIGCSRTGLQVWLNSKNPLWDDTAQAGNEAVYGNPGDLGVGRRAFCEQELRGPPTPGLYTVCYATAHGIPPGQVGFNDPQTITHPGEGVGDDFILSMVITKDPTGTVFLVLGKNGKYTLSPTVKLDTEGAKLVPFACLSCHGGTYNAATRKVDGASFLPLDPGLLAFATPADQAGQEEKIRAINTIIVNSNPTSAVAAYLRGLYGNAVAVAGTHATPDYVPQGWTQQAGFYRQVVRPYCATCHLAAPASWNFASWSNFQDNAALIKAAVCYAHTMPHSELQFKGFWTKDTGPVYLPGLLATTLGFPSCP